MVSPAGSDPSMRQRLAEVFAVPTDLDYVQAFQNLAFLVLEIRKSGPDAARLLRKSLLEREVGNHQASLEAVNQALELDPLNPEAHYELGLAYLYLALAKAEALPVGPTAPALPYESITDLLSLAVESFSKVVELNPADEDAAQDLAAIAEVLAIGADDLAVAQALRTK